MQEKVSQSIMLAKVLKIVWILCSVAVLIVTLVRDAPGPSSDIGVFLVYGMLFLAFPVSLLVAGLFGRKRGQARISPMSQVRFQDKTKCATSGKAGFYVEKYEPGPFDSCIQRRWSGPCGECLNKCTAQQEWPFEGPGPACKPRGGPLECEVPN
jgi:hypothetical protein